jgi:hypothetical protein
VSKTDQRKSLKSLLPSESLAVSNDKILYAASTAGGETLKYYEGGALNNS